MIVLLVLAGNIWCLGAAPGALLCEIRPAGGKPFVLNVGTLTVAATTDIFSDGFESAGTGTWK